MPDHTFTDEDKRDLWERILTTPSEEQFREFVLEQLDLRPDDTVLSVGCGPGFETAAIARHVGEDGHITGLDVNGAVLAAARDRCAGVPHVSFVQGDITALPVAAERYDLVVAKQVLSAVSDVKTALAELSRVVKSDGRVAVTAGGVRTHVMHSPTDRLHRANEIYRSEMAERRLGTRLVASLPEAGFTVEEVIPYAKTKTEIDEQVKRGIDVQRGLLEAHETFDADEIDAWELRELDTNDRYLSSSTSFLYIARKPGEPCTIPP